MIGGAQVRERPRSHGEVTFNYAAVEYVDRNGAFYMLVVRGDDMDTPGTTHKTVLFSFRPRVTGEPGGDPLPNSREHASGPVQRLRSIRPDMHPRPDPPSGLGRTLRAFRTGDRAMTKLLRWYLRLVAGLTIISCLGQLGLPSELGAASAWGVASGWQREIAFWDLAMYIVIARTLRANDAVAGRMVAIALVVLQLLVATNHAAAAIQSHAMLNVLMGAVNYGCVMFGTLALRVHALPASATAMSTPQSQQ